eukprot:Filipodium_phascolosomae@DN8478_c0_g1_i1.p1
MTDSELFPTFDGPIMDAPVNVEDEERLKRREQARLDIEQFYAERAREITARKEKNKKEEELMIEGHQCKAIENPWQKVPALAQLNATGVRDRSRMKQIYLELKANN